ncbi:HINT domain-containing protein, partial [Frankia sp. AiPs1]|uniref:polymorphic toxin-type HINT domain-containing protein n=1 Tax=Frankia sp. AiPs1 TaxID=573493 RepID=UPI002043E89F
PDAPAAGGRPAPAAQPAAPASPELFENPCDTTGGGVAPLASSCRPVTPDQTCWQSGNRYTDRYDETQARICAQGGSAGGPAGGALESCTPNSFDGDTAVLMADGTRKRIRDVRVGDRVLATDPVTGRTEARTVTALIVGQGLKHLVAVSVDTGHGSAALTATDHHPFWDDVDHGWVDADDLTSADELRTPTGSHIRVTATREYDRTQTVYNLTVDTLHTYYVLAGQTPVLVHNAGALGPDEMYLWRAVTGAELTDLQGTRQFRSTQGVKYFSFTEQGAAEYARRAYGNWPGEGPYTMIRTVAKKADIPGLANMPHTSDVVDGGIALQDDVLSKLGRPRIIPSMSATAGCR